MMNLHLIASVRHVLNTNSESSSILQLTSQILRIGRLVLELHGTLVLAHMYGNSNWMKNIF